MDEILRYADGNTAIKNVAAPVCLRIEGLEEYS